MTPTAMIMMICGMLIIWGGFWLSIANVIIKNKK